MKAKEKDLLPEHDDSRDLSPFTEERTSATPHPELVKEDVADRKQSRQLRQYAFYGVSALVMTLAILFVTWTGSFGARLFFGTYRVDPATSGILLTLIIVIAALVAVPLLALIRFVFRETGPIDEEKNGVTIWQLLIKELSDVFKTYLGGRKPAA